LVKIVQKYQASHMEAQVRFNVSATQIHHNSIVVPRSRSLYCWRWRVSQQHMQNAMLLYHCNNGHASMPQCYVICKFPILLLFYLATLSITIITWVCGSEQECDYGTLVEYWRRKQKMSVKQPHCPPKTAYARSCDRIKVFAVRSLAYMEPKCSSPCSQEPDKALYPATNPVIYAYVLLWVFRSNLCTGLHTLFHTKHKHNTVYLCKKRGRW